MDIKRSLVTKIELTDLRRLDPVQVIAEDLGTGRGKITVSCFGKAWTNTWYGIGPQTISEFIPTCHVDYLAGKLMSTYNEWETDWEQVAKDIGISHHFMSTIDEHTAYQYEDELGLQYGTEGDWRMNLPQRLTSDYIYLCRIVEAMIEGFKEIEAEYSA